MTFLRLDQSHFQAFAKVKCNTNESEYISLPQVKEEIDHQGSRSVRLGVTCLEHWITTLYESTR